MNTPSADSIVGTRAVTGARLAPASFEGPLPSGPYDVLAVIDGSAVGGGTVTHDDSGAGVVVSACWAVADLDAPHWAALLGPKGLRPVAVPAGTGGAVRATIDRLARHHARAAERAQCRAEGLRDALGVAARTGVDIGIDVGRAAGGPGAGR